MASALCINPMAATAASFGASSAAKVAPSLSEVVPSKPVKVCAVIRRRSGPGYVSARARRLAVRANAGELSATQTEGKAQNSSAESEEGRWIPVVPLSALPRGERRLIRQGGETILLLWYKSEVYGIENTSPAEGAYSEGFLNAKLTQDGCIVCPSTDTTFDLKTGAIKEWYPSNPVLRFLTRPVRELQTYPVKMDSDYIYVDLKRRIGGEAAEIIFGGAIQAGKTATNVDVEETRMVEVDEREAGGFGFTPDNEITNGRAAMIGFSALLVIELVTGKGILKGTGFLDFLYRFLPGFPLL